MSSAAWPGSSLTPMYLYVREMEIHFPVAISPRYVVVPDYFV